MTVKEAAHRLGFEILAGEQGLDTPISCVYCCDLLSFAMGRAPESSAWVTVMGNVNAVAVASLTDVSCIVLAESAQADDQALQKANTEGIPILSSKNSVFETAKAIDQNL